MNQEHIEDITVDTLRARATAKRQEGQRLVQVSATRLPDQLELTYSFDLNRQLTNLRLLLPGKDTCLPSISAIYGCAILYENEIHDLFDVQVDGLTVDFKGNFYKTKVKFPFGNLTTPCAVAKAAAAGAPGAPAATPTPATTN